MTSIIKASAVRLGRSWVVSIPELGVYAHGGTLTAAGHNTGQALELLGVDAEVALTAVTPELDVLRQRQAAYDLALADAVFALARRRTSFSDISQATGVPRGRLREILSQPATPAPTAAVEADETTRHP